MNIIRNTSSGAARHLPLKVKALLPSILGIENGLDKNTDFVIALARAILPSGIRFGKIKLENIKNRQDKEHDVN